MQDVSGIVATKKIVEMKKIEIEYFSSRDTNFEVELHPDIVVLPRDALEEGPVEQRVAPRLPPTSHGVAGFRITAGGLRLRM
jgi:hypothetical protein